MSHEVRGTLERLLNAAIFTLGQTSVALETLIVFALLLLGTWWLPESRSAACTAACASVATPTREPRPSLRG